MNTKTNNSTDYFSSCSDVAAVKSLYRELAMKHHPDLHQDDPTATETMQTINAAYIIALKSCDGQTSTGTDKREHTYTYNEVNEYALMEKVQAILSSQLPEGVTVWLIGTWIWVRGTDRADKATQATLKELKMRWSAKRGAWHWTASKRRGRYNKNADLDGLANKYGARTFSAKRSPALA